MRTSNVERRTSNVEVKQAFLRLFRGMVPPAHATMFAFFCFLLAGCARLSPGPISTAPPQICLVRGYLDWYSTGIDRLTTELCIDGNDARAYREEQWGDLADELARYPRRPVILIGFSYGADDVILIARRLSERHLPVDLLITIDPVTPAQLPQNVRKAVNFYQPNGFWDIFPWLRGFPIPGDENINVRQRSDLIEPNTSHATIAANEKIHAAIRALVSQATTASLPQSLPDHPIAHP